MGYLTYDFPHTTFYDSDLRELVEMYKKLLGDYTDIVNDIVKLQDEYDTIDIKIAEQISKFEITMTSKVEQMLDAFGNTVDTKLDNMQTTVDTVRKDMSALEDALAELEAGIGTLRDYVDTLNASTIDKLEKEIIDMTNMVWDEIYTINDRIDKIVKEYPDVQDPITYQYMGLQRVLNEMYDALRVLAFTAYAFDSFAMTAAEFDNLGLTAYEFDTMGEYKAKDIYIKFMQSPSTGKRTTIKYALYDATSVNAEYAGTASFFDSKGLTAKEFDDLLSTAYGFDFYGMTLISDVAELIPLGNGYYESRGIVDATNTGYTIDTKGYTPVSVNAVYKDDVSNKWLLSDADISVDNIQFAVPIEDEQTTKLSFNILLKAEEER